MNFCAHREWAVDYLIQTTMKWSSNNDNKLARVQNQKSDCYNSIADLDDTYFLLCKLTKLK